MEQLSPLLPCTWGDLPCHPAAKSYSSPAPSATFTGSLILLNMANLHQIMVFPGWSCIVCLTKSSTVECAPLPSVHISSSVSFYCENKSRCSHPFWMALRKRRRGGNPRLERTSPIDYW